MKIRILIILIFTILITILTASKYVHEYSRFHTGILESKDYFLKTMLNSRTDIVIDPTNKTVFFSSKERDSKYSCSNFWLYVQRDKGYFSYKKEQQVIPTIYFSCLEIDQERSNSSQRYDIGSKSYDKVNQARNKLNTAKAEVQTFEGSISEYLAEDHTREEISQDIINSTIIIFIFSVLISVILREKKHAK